MPEFHENLSRYAKYPFMKGAGEYVKEMGVDMRALLEDRAYEAARILGGERATKAVRFGRLDAPSLISDVDILNELLSYPIARMIISCTDDQYVIKRYALAEAVRAKELIAEEDNVCMLELSEELGLDASLANEEIVVHFADYLRHTVQMKSKEAKLINQRLEDGQVYLSKIRFARILQQAVQERLESELPLPTNDIIQKEFSTLSKALKEEAASKRKNFDAANVGRVRTMYLPPCMKQLLARLQAGENLPHSGRFALTAFLHALGMNNEDIMKAFSLSPDFKESLARYQVEHISGGSGTEYTPPGCDAMKTYGICPGEDDLCAREWLNHPLTYYRAKQKRGDEQGRGRPKKARAEKEKAKGAEESAGPDVSPTEQG